MNSKLRLERGLFLPVLVVLQINKIIRQWQAFSNTVYQNIPWGFELIFKQIFLLFRHYLFLGLHTITKFTIFHFIIDTKISHNDFSRFTKKNASSVMKAKAIGCHETRKWGLDRLFPAFSHEAPFGRQISGSFQQLNTWILCTSCNVTLKTWRMGEVFWIMYAAWISIKKPTVK